MSEVIAFEGYPEKSSQMKVTKAQKAADLHRRLYTNSDYMEECHLICAPHTRKLPRSFDNMTATWYFVNDTKWIAYDDRNSLEQKNDRQTSPHRYPSLTRIVESCAQVPQLLAAYAPDCVYVEDVQRDDARGVCDRPFPLVSSLQGMLAEALQYTTHVAGSSTAASSIALVAG
ncbi:hypothetical protein HPB51_004987 [Rhipicephalus microplus]|uniref:Uncharacterized protein n=1 Tax=Rhipicephalus microplus TaxID=6941 RepID=A0A9J6EXB4_RHIMP|nr:hypothetical protein HPB51_004987 [Rhipicephalus microplus]